MKKIHFIFLIIASSALLSACNYATHRTLSDPSQRGKEDPEPDYNISLDENYQDFVSYLFLGNRIENFSTYFNTFYIAQEDFEAAMKEYRTSTIANYNRRLDSLNVTPILTQSMKDKYNKVIERASKVIQFHKNSKFIDDAVLLIGKSYFYLTDYPQAERSFNEFLSKLNVSDKSDEALLFLGRTLFSLRKDEEAVNILTDLISKSKDNEIRASAAQELGIYEFNKKNYEQAVEYFKSSINYTKDSDRKADRQFILAKMYSIFKPSMSAGEYAKAVSFTSDYDLRFFSRLNYARGLTVNRDFNRAFKELEDLKRQYRDDANYRQVIDLETANTLFSQKQYDRALRKYYEVIIDYPNTLSAAESYYNIGKYYEEIKKDYFNALINYQKAVSENHAFDYYIVSSGKVTTLDRYFQLQADANGSSKIEIPLVNNELEKYRKKYNESRGIIDPNAGTNGTNYRGGRDEGEGKGKPGGSGSRGSESVAKDTIDKIDMDEQEDFTPEEFESGRTGERESKSGKTNERESKSGKTNEQEYNYSETVENKSSDEEQKFRTYYELAEIFLYELNQRDSAEFYLRKLLNDFPSSPDRVKIMYVMASFYKDSEPATAENLYRQIIENYPNTQYSIESRKALGLPYEDISIEPAEDLYKNAFRFIENENYSEAIIPLKEILNKYPESSYNAKSIYTLGWIYENHVKDIDSMIAYYSMLWEKYPESEFSIRVTPVLEYMLTERSKIKNTNENIRTPNENNEKGDMNEETMDEEIDNEQEMKDEDDGKERLSQEEIERLLKDSGE